MKKTVVISPYVKGVSGTLDHESDGGCITVHIRLNHSAGEDSILRLYALSTAHAVKMPYLAEMFDGRSEDMSALIGKDDLNAVGYAMEDIDTYLITEYSPEGEWALAGAFLGLEWCAPRFLQPKYKLPNSTQSVSTDEPLPNAPLSKAKEILDERRNGAFGAEYADAAAERFGAEVSVYPVVTIKGCDMYRWHRIDNAAPIGLLSSVAHIIKGSRTRSIIGTYGYYVAGVCRRDAHHIAVGIPSDIHIDPSPQVSDCSRFCDGYHITGIFFAKDGQYFEKYLQN